MFGIFTLVFEEAAIEIRQCFKCSLDTNRDIYLLWSGHSAALLNSLKSMEYFSRKYFSRKRPTRIIYPSSKAVIFWICLGKSSGCKSIALLKNEFLLYRFEITGTLWNTWNFLKKGISGYLFAFSSPIFFKKQTTYSFQDDFLTNLKTVRFFSSSNLHYLNKVLYEVLWIINFYSKYLALLYNN